MKKNSDDYKAVALAADVKIDGGKINAISISIEHKNGPTIQVVTPYILKGIFEKDIQFEESYVSSFEKFVWND